MRLMGCRELSSLVTEMPHKDADKGQLQAKPLPEPGGGIFKKGSDGCTSAGPSWG